MRTWAKIAIPILLILLASLCARVLIKTRPEANRKAPAERATLVEVRPLNAAPITLRIPAQGTVIPAQQIALKPEVNGRVIELSPALIPGGRLRAGQLIARLDDRDLKMTLAEREAQLARARLDLAMEKGRRDVARREWALINSDEASKNRAANNELALRVPHIASANAAVDAASAAVERARRDIERATLRAPFNAIIKDESLDLGQIISAQNAVATLVGTDRFLIQASVPLEALDALQLPDDEGRRGSPVEVFASNSDSARTGQVIRVLGDLDPVGRMARLLIAIDDPLNLRPANDDAERQPPLFLGDYVRVEILGMTYAKAFEVPRETLRAGKQLWLYKDERLEIRPIQPVWRGAKSVVVIDGLAEDELLITSPIATAIAGMKLRRPAPKTAADATPREQQTQEKRS